MVFAHAAFNLCTGGDGETYFAAFAALNLLVNLETFLEAACLEMVFLSSCLHEFLLCKVKLFLCYF